MLHYPRYIVPVSVVGNRSRYKRDVNALYHERRACSILCIKTPRAGDIYYYYTGADYDRHTSVYTYIYIYTYIP